MFCCIAWCMFDCEHFSSIRWNQERTLGRQRRTATDLNCTAEIVKLMQTCSCKNWSSSAHQHKPFSTWAVIALLPYKRPHDSWHDMQAKQWRHRCSWSTESRWGATKIVRTHSKAEDIRYKGHIWGQQLSLVLFFFYILCSSVHSTRPQSIKKEPQWVFLHTVYNTRF